MIGRSLSIRARLMTITGVGSALFLFALFFSLLGTQRVSGHFQEFIEVDQARLETLRTMQAEGSQAVIAAAKKILVPKLEPPMRVATNAAATFDEALNKARELYAGDPKGAATIEQITKLWEEGKPLTLRSIELVDKGQLDEARTLFTSKAQKLWGNVRKQLQPLIKLEAERVVETRQRVDEDVRSTFWTGTGLGVLALIAGMIINLVVGNRISAAVQRAAAGLEDIAEGGGDLTARLPVEGGRELERLSGGFNQFASETQVLIRQVTESAEQMNKISGELSRLAGGSRRIAEKQEEAMGQVATAMTEMTYTVKNVAESAATAASAAGEADEQARCGSDVVSKTIGAIQKLSDDVDKATDTMSSLEKETEQVGGVLSVIREIADQTNLLALNAAIEAARAGEMGRGFAVVADEVRTLASRTQNSTQEVGDIIERLQKGAASTAAMMHASRESAQQTVSQAAAAEDALRAITKSVTRIRDMNSEIASAAEEQGAVSEDIQRNTEAVNELAQQSAETTNLTEQTGQELKVVAEQVSRLMHRFKVD